MDGRKIILVVDDMEINRKVLIKILSDDYDCIEASNGEDAWNQIMEKENEITAVLLDIVMPKMNGYEFLEKVKQAALTELPIIAVTSDADKESERMALDAGAWDFVTKPYQPKVLKARLKNAIARSQVSVYKRMHRMMHHDTLTGLYNREKTFSMTRKVLNENPNDTFIFIRGDIDRFALYNSAFGETEGNNLIRFLAEEFSKIAHRYEPVAYGRINADVFCACMPYDGNAKQLEKEINMVQERLAKYRSNYRLEISVGAFVIDDKTISIEECYLRANIAVQKCKNKYGIHVAFYDEGSIQKAEEQVAIESMMKEALETHQFEVYLQPKIVITTEKACGAEALVRWVHPKKGLLFPGVFIPVFESNGFIADLDYYVWEETCRILREWIDSGEEPLPISVNISRISLYNPQITDLLKGLIEKYDLNEELLQLEITESAYMSNPDLMKSIVKTLRNAGFTILMDDFGSGYSSLNTLKDMEVDILKLDLKFLPEHDKVGKGEIILASMIRLAKWLGMDAVVEGVETKSQRDFLEGAGCSYIQGYYYSRPIQSKDFTKKYIKEDVKELRVAKIEEEKEKNNNTILLVDDAETDRDIITNYFGDKYYICECESAEEALVYMKRNHRYVKLIIVDIVLPEMSGLDFLIHCQDEPAFSTIPKIIITSSDASEDQVKAFRNGAYDYITKPLNMEIVEARINHAITRKNYDRELQSYGNSYQNLAERDRATGLLNKIAFSEIADHYLGEFNHELMALLVIDLDNFKSINDNYGHLVGDKVISILANTLTNIFRKSDVIGRFGGDEFTVFMTNLPNEEIARNKAEDVVRNVSLEVSKDLNIEATVSIGVAFSNEKSELEEIFGRADSALYDAKKAGKCKVTIYGEEVPPIVDDNKPIVLVCGEDPQLFPTIALAYGNSASFAEITSFDKLKEAFDIYGERISAICMDIQKKHLGDSDDFYDFIISNGGGDTIPLFAVCKEGDMVHFREAVTLKVQDVLTLPLNIDTIKRRLSRAIAVSRVK